MRFFGHPIHPMLVHFPIVFWTVATAAYISAAAGIGEPAAAIATWANGAGLVMATCAMVAGLLEIRLIDSQSKAMNVVTWHMMIMGTALIWFLLALLLPRLGDFARATALIAAAACACAGFLSMAIGGWLGGQLVYGLGVGVKEQANAGP